MARRRRRRRKGGPTCDMLRKTMRRKGKSRKVKKARGRALAKFREKGCGK